MNCNPAPHLIHQGDCIAGMQQIPAGSIDLVFADPPFNIGYEYDQYDDRQDEAKYLAWCQQWMEQVFRVLKAEGTFWLAIGDEYAAELKLLAKQLGFTTRSWVVWYYTFGVHCQAKFTRSHAHLFYFTKHPSRFTFNRDQIAVPSARQMVYGDRRANPAGRVPDDTWILRPQDVPASFQADEDTWFFPRVSGTFKERAGFHGCQMPEQLLGRIIKACSRPGEVVLDPFAGSASTLVVAKKLGRQSIGFELSPDYARRGGERLEAVTPGEPLVGSADPLHSAPATGSSRARKLDDRRPTTDHIVTTRTVPAPEPPATGPSATGPSATGPSATGPSATGASADRPAAMQRGANKGAARRRSAGEDSERRQAKLGFDQGEE